MGLAFLNLSQADLVCEQFKIHSVVVNARYEPILLSNAAILTANKNLTKNKKRRVYRSKSATSQHPTSSEDAGPSSFSVWHCGSMTVNHRRVNSELIDCLVSILSLSSGVGDSMATERRARWKMKKKSRTGKTNSMFQDDSTDKDFVDGVGSVESTESSSLLPTFHLPTGDAPDDGVVVDEEKVIHSAVGQGRHDLLRVSRCASLSLPKSKGGWRSGDSESSGSESPAGQ